MPPNMSSKKGNHNSGDWSYQDVNGGYNASINDLLLSSIRKDISNENTIRH